MRIKHILLFLFFILCTFHTYSQTYKAYVNAGETAFNNGDYYSAKAYYMRALEFEIEDPEVSFKTAEASRLFNDYYAAAYYYNQTIRLDKDKHFPIAMFWLATMNKMMGEYETAKNLFYQYYNLHAVDSNYYSQRAGREIKDCETAQEMMKDSVPADVKNLGNRINTVYSDFAGQLVKDSILYYSSLRFENKDPKTKKTKNYISKILQSKPNGENFRQPQPLDSTFNLPDLHDCNAAFSSDNKLMIFTRCTPVNYSEMRCELYESKNLKGKWQLPVRLNDSINLKNYTSTQPSIANNSPDGYILYFVSDRPGGYGKTDIWKSLISTDGKYSQPENPGPNINTIDEEMTPYFSNSLQTLYFSSNGFPGMGGYDIFKSKMTNNSFSAAENIGYPLNTSYHDLYYTTNDAGDNGLLSSNRLGSMYIKNKTCCYDIYAYNLLKADTAKMSKDSIAAIAAISAATLPAIKSTEEPVLAIDLAKQLLPLELYFHNDEPDAKTTKSYTHKNYQDLYNSYIAMKKEYSKAFSAPLSGEEKDKALQSIDDFFDTTVKENFNRLEKFSGLLLEELKTGKKITITVRGFTSPLAKSDYNISLSKRRISSFINYLKTYENGSIDHYLQNEMLRIVEDPAGETYVKKGVSDELSDKRNSVYSPAAAAERKIQVIDVKID
jgi:tetratricopeptide (TPR) repeat protein